MKSLFAMGMAFVLTFTGYSSCAQTDRAQPITRSNAAQVSPLATVSESDVIVEGASTGVLAGYAGRGGYSPGIAWSPDGTQLAVYRPKGTWLYDTQDFTHLPRLLEGNLIDTRYAPSPVLAYSPDSQIVLTTSSATDIDDDYGLEATTTAHHQPGSNVYLWNVATGQQKTAFHIPLDPVETAAFSADGARIALGGCLSGVAQDYHQIGCAHGGAIIWDTGANQLTFTLDGHPASVTSLAFSPDGRLLATGDSQRVQLWDLPGAQMLHSWESSVPLYWENTLAFSPDNQQLIMARGNVEIWRLDDYTLAQVLRSEDSQLGYSNVHLLPDGTLALSSRLYEGSPLIQQQVIWDGEQIVVNTIPPLDAVRAAVNANGTRVAYSEMFITIADPIDQTIQAVLANPIETTALSFSPDNQYLAVGGGFAQGGRAMIWIWDAKTGELAQRKTYAQGKNYLGGLHTLRYLSNGDLIGSMALGSDVPLWDSDTLEEIERWHAFETAREIREQQGTVAMLTNLGTVILRNLATGTEIMPMGIAAGDILMSTALSPTRSIMAAGAQHTLYIIDTHNGNVLAAHEAHTDWIWQLAFSPDGRWLASASEDGTVRRWDMTGENASRIVASNALPNTELAFSPDNTLLAWGNATGGVDVWDLRTDQPLITLGEQMGETDHLAFNPAGDVLATGGRDGIVRLWDFTTGQPLVQLGGHVDAIAALIFSPDGSRLATLTRNGQAVLWGIPD